MKLTGIVLSISPYDYKSKTGERVQGLNFFYMLTDSLMPVAADETGRKGSDPQQGRLAYESVKEFTEVPGIYDLDVVMQTSRMAMGGSMTVQGVKFKGSIVGAVDSRSNPAK